MKKLFFWGLLILSSSPLVAAPSIKNCATVATEISQWINEGKNVAASYMSNGMMTKLPQNRLFGYSSYFEGSCSNRGGAVECSGEALNSHSKEGSIFDQASAKAAKIKLEQGGRILLQKDSSYAAPTSQECFGNSQGNFVRSTYTDALESRIVTFIFRKNS